MNQAGGNFRAFQSRSDRQTDSSNGRGELQQQLSSLAKQLLSVATSGAQHPSTPSDQADHSDNVIAHRLRQMFQNRRIRERFFSPNLFADPAWDILLDLALARIEQRQVCVSSLAIAASVPTSTALRWIKALLDLQLIARVADPNDRRRTYIHIADEPYGKMLEYARTLKNWL